MHEKFHVIIDPTKVPIACLPVLCVKHAMAECNERWSTVDWLHKYRIGDIFFCKNVEERECPTQIEKKKEEKNQSCKYVVK